MKKLLPLLAVAFGATALAHSQTMVSMTRDLNYNGVYGAGADTQVPSNAANAITMVNIDTLHLDFSGSTSGTLPGGSPYAGSAGCNLDNRFTVGGSLPSFTSIVASGASFASATSSGGGVGVMHCSNPGNKQLFQFQTSGAIDYTFNGAIDQGGAPGNVFEYVSLQRFDGFTWANVFFSPFGIPGGEGSFSTAGTLLAGDYRLIGLIQAESGTNSSQSSSYNFAFNVVPEPVSTILLVPGLALLARRRRR